MHAIEQELLSQLQTKYKIKLGIGVQAGWLPLLVDFFKEMESKPYFNNIIWDQIKEKFGGLRIYYDLSKEIHEESRGLINYEIEKIIEKYENRAETTCHFCSKPGTRNTIKGWMMIICPRCVHDQQ